MAFGIPWLLSPCAPMCHARTPIMWLCRWLERLDVLDAFEHPVAGGGNIADSADSPLRGQQREDLFGDLQHPAGHAGPVIPRPVQLETHHPRLSGPVDGIPAEREVTRQPTGFRADVRPVPPIQIDARSGI